MEQEHNLFWIWLAECLGAENHDFARLIATYDPYELFHADESELERIDGITKRTVARLSNKSLMRASAINDDCLAMGIDVIPYDSLKYPPLLRGLRCPPVVLYCKGELPDVANKLCIGTVGTRKMSHYGMRVAYQLSYQLASCGAVVVSGMASGIDGVSAAAAIAAGGKTVAVIGCGIDVIYPKNHDKLMQEIVRHGAVISEYPPKTPVRGYQFPIRNRIISGLSQATVVVEAGVSSGSLITAKDAILQGRSVYAFPANVGNKVSEGTNMLLRDGVNLALSAADVLSEYADAYSAYLDMSRLTGPPRITDEVLAYLRQLDVIRSLDQEADRQNESAIIEPVKRQRAGRKASVASSGADRESPAQERKVTDAPPKEKKKTPDEVLSSLTELQREVLAGMPDDRSVSLDDLRGIGKAVGEVVAALTVLEILGLVEKLPGGLYTKS